MSYDFNTHTIQIPCVDLLNYLRNLCDDNGIEYKVYYLSKYNKDVYWEDVPDTYASSYNIELDFIVQERDESFMEFVKYLYQKHLDNIMELESNLFNSDRIINNCKDTGNIPCGFIAYVL